MTKQKSKPSVRPEELAIDAANRYFAALGREIPFDTAPGDVNLIDAVNAIEDALLQGESYAKYSPDDARHHAALEAGYILGIEIGRRMGGAR